MKKLFSFLFFLSFIFFWTSGVSHAAPECRIPNNATCSACSGGSQSCDGVYYDPTDPNNTAGNPLIGEDCTASRTCAISENSCDCGTAQGYDREATACQPGSTCSGVNANQPVPGTTCHHCVTPQRDCNTDPVCNITYGTCSAPANSCGTNNGTLTACLYTRYNGEEGCELRNAPNQPCTVNKCPNGYVCNANGTCTPGTTNSCTPGGLKGSYCDNTGGACQGKIVNTYWGDPCGSPDTYVCTNTSCSNSSCNVNNVQDGAETGVDCGGPNCPECGDPPVVGCSGNSGPFCGSNFTVTALDRSTGQVRTVSSVTYATTNSGDNIPNGSTIVINPGDVIQTKAVPASVLSSADCRISYNGRYDYVRKAPIPIETINRCFEWQSSYHSYYCENGQGKLAYRRTPITNFDALNPDGIGSIPPLQHLQQKRGCGYSHADRDANGNIIRHVWKCSACALNGRAYHAGGQAGIDSNFEGNSTEDSNGNPVYTPYNWGPMHRFDHGTHNLADDEEAELPVYDDACYITPDDYPNSPQTEPKSPQGSATDNITKKQFNSAGEYRVEYRTARSGINGGAMDNNPCVVKVIVRNPEPPSGSITATPPTCIIPDGQQVCNSTISWNTSDADNIHIVLSEDGAVFAPPGTAVDGSSSAPWISATPVTFDLYGSSYSFPNNALLASVTVRGNPYINGDIFIDINENGIRDTGETTYTSGGNVFINGTPTSLDGNGHYARTNIIPSSYEVAFTAPTGYQLTTASPRSISLTQPTTVNFGIAPLHTVSGRIFNDRNKNRVYDTGDSLYTDNVTISGTTNGSPVETTTNGGNYTLSNIPTGLRTISLTSPLPSGYRIIWPRATTPPSYSVQVGPSCASGPLDTTTGASYTNQTECDIQNLDFAVSDSVPWIQMIGSDGRFDGGLSNSVANNLACNGGYTLIPGNNTAPGVLLIGPSSPNTSFGGIGAASATNWVIGSPFPEYFTFFGSNPDAQAAGIQTSYDYLLGAAQTSNITPTNLTTLCSDLSNCTLNNPPNGIYQANGDVTLTGNSTMSANRDYIFLINGDLTINGRLTTPVSSTTTFSAKGDITVTQTVGVSAFACPSPLTNGQIQGFFSADESIIINAKDSTGQGANCSNGDGEDLQLNVDGALVANAALGGGSFINRRDLCSFNTTYPSLTVKERLDFVLNAPELLKTNTYIYREVAP